MFNPKAWHSSRKMQILTSIWDDSVNAKQVHIQTSMLHMVAWLRIISMTYTLFGLVQGFVSRRLRISEGSRVETIQSGYSLLEEETTGKHDSLQQTNASRRNLQFPEN